MDLFNHTTCSRTSLDIIHTKLHLANNKIYLYKHDFNNILKASGKSEIEEELADAQLDPLEDVDYSDQYKF